MGSLYPRCRSGRLFLPTGLRVSVPPSVFPVVDSIAMSEYCAMMKSFKRYNTSVSYSFPKHSRPSRTMYKLIRTIYTTAAHTPRRTAFVVLRFCFVILLPLHLVSLENLLPHQSAPNLQLTARKEASLSLGA